MKKTMIIIGIALLSLAGIAVGFMAFNQIIPIGVGLHAPVYQANNAALDGYDVTTYFKNGPKKGNSKYSTQMFDATWHFTSEENLLEFKNHPRKFLPKYGGYCTKAVSTGFTAPADPKVYAIYNGDLFIFSNEEVKAEFISNPQSIIAACGKNWK